jgi:hypothetical protein
MYKDKFKDWGWYKNLPSAMALWMFQKWDQRMKEVPSKDTNFEMGGRTWTSSQVLKRVQRTGGQQAEAISEGIRSSRIFAALNLTKHLCRCNHSIRCPILDTTRCPFAARNSRSWCSDSIIS